MRDCFSWQLGARALQLGRRTLVMGVVNITPDSFSDGGRFLAPERAVGHALALLDEGADILDLGGESTRPGTATSVEDSPASSAVSEQQEQDRVLPVIEALKRERPGAVLSIDTYKASTARAAVDAGAEIVNDVSGLTWDAAMAATVAELGCGAVLMHTRGRPSEWNALPPEPNLLALVRQGLAGSVEQALAAGIKRDRIVLDPGFGFGKQGDENYSLLAHLDTFAELGFPLLAGASRKSFVGHTVGQRLAELGARHCSNDGSLSVPPQDRLFGTLATVVAAVLKGAHIVRVHDVRPAVEAVAVADAILATG